MIGGITFHGRTYRNIGYDWIEYVAQLDDNRALSIGLRNMDCVPGTMPDIILNNMGNYAQNYNASTGQYGQYRCNRLRFVSGSLRRDTLYPAGSGVPPIPTGRTSAKPRSAVERSTMSMRSAKRISPGAFSSLAERGCVPLRCNRCRRQQCHRPIAAFFVKTEELRITMQHVGGSAEGYCRVPHLGGRPPYRYQWEVSTIRWTGPDRYAGHLHVLR